ncbi:AAA family ATPase [Kamptonema sp. UHCC 0994]|uniref:AAA family ATPase n=1 Tax=Kamptonema sp. UHCC 0994 TaxID=3031329 RepID=UPI0023BAB7C7|nr:AAA family ATPase [Kamptonema sp. UHCC 0994]MDF0556942.1 AAA family ATPase [Kamptonema sp. UHCC 0994]
MSYPQQFPASLLTQSQAERLAYFDNYTMAHPRLDEAVNLLKLLVKESGESRVIFIYGPTGVGKTTLRLIIEKWLIESTLPELEADPGRLPVASVEAVVQKSGLFNSKDHIKRCLFALNEPLIDQKIDYGTRGIYRNNNGQVVIESKVIETDLGWALEQALKHRKPKIFFIDEAHHLLMVASGRKLTDLPEAIKSLANRTEVVHGLVGTYELLTLHDIGDQLSRRSVYVHFPRYRAEVKEDREIFQSVVWGFQLHLPLPEVPDLLSNWDYCYERSLGCVGILKNWLRNALADAIAEGAVTVGKKHLERRALGVAQCRNILKKIKEGESNHALLEAEVEQLRTELGLSVISVQSKSDSKLFPEFHSGNNLIRKRSKKVGQPKPKRHQVGVK